MYSVRSMLRSRSRVVMSLDNTTKVYPRTKKILAAINSDGSKVFICPKTGETTFIKSVN